MSTVIKQSVGHGGKNNHADVQIVQQLLNNYRCQTPASKSLRVNGICGADTLAAITAFQISNSLKIVDGRIDPNGATIVRLLKQAKANLPRQSGGLPSSTISLGIPVFNLFRYLYRQSMFQIEADHDNAGGTDVSLRSESEFKLLVATIYGEAANSSETAWQAIAFVIKNWVGKREWTRYKTIADIIKRTGFDAHTHRNAPYIAAEQYLNENVAQAGNNKRIEKMIEVLTPVYLNQKSDITSGAVLYYSPKAQTALHKTNPKMWKQKPDWNFALLQEVNIPALLSSDDFKFYKYK